MGPFFVLLNLQPLELGRGQGVGHVGLDVCIPADDVNFLVVEFPDDIFHPLSAKPDAGADGVHFFIPRVHRELGAEARLPGDGLDLDRAIVDLGDLELKQLEHKVGVPSGEDDLRIAVCALHGFYQASDAFAPLVFLGGHTLAVGQQRFEFAQVNEDIRAVKPPNLAADDLTDAVFELGVNQRFLGPANGLHQRLLGILRGNPAKVFRSDFDFKFLIQLSARFVAFRRVETYFALFVGDCLHHDQGGEGADVTVLAVDFTPQLPGGADRPLRRGDHCVLDSADEDLPIEPLFALPILHAGYKFRIHRYRLSTSSKPFVPNKKAGRLLSDFTHSQQS